MAAGVGGDRPYTPKEPDPDELNAESLFNEFKNLQRRNKWLQGVRLELNPDAPERGEAGHFQRDYMDQDPASGEFFMRPPTIRLFLDSLRRGYEASRGAPRAAGGQPTRSQDFTKYVKATLRHEAAHAWQMEQNRIKAETANIPPEQRRDFGDEPQLKPTKGRAAYIDVPAHGKLFNVLNRMLAGSGAEALLPKIGLPREFWHAQRSQNLPPMPSSEHPGIIIGGKG